MPSTSNVLGPYDLKTGRTISAVYSATARLRTLALYRTITWAAAASTNVDNPNVAGGTLTMWPFLPTYGSKPGGGDPPAGTIAIGTRVPSSGNAIGFGAILSSLPGVEVSAAVLAPSYYGPQQVAPPGGSQPSGVGVPSAWYVVSGAGDPWPSATGIVYDELLPGTETISGVTYDRWVRWIGVGSISVVGAAPPSTLCLFDGTPRPYAGGYAGANANLTSGVLASSSGLDPAGNATGTWNICSAALQTSSVTGWYSAQFGTDGLEPYGHIVTISTVPVSSSTESTTVTSGALTLTDTIYEIEIQMPVTITATLAERFYNNYGLNVGFYHTLESAAYTMGSGSWTIANATTALIRGGDVGMSSGLQQAYGVVAGIPYAEQEVKCGNGLTGGGNCEYVIWPLAEVNSAQITGAGGGVAALETQTTTSSFVSGSSTAGYTTTVAGTTVARQYTGASGTAGNVDIGGAAWGVGAGCSAVLQDYLFDKTTFAEPYTQKQLGTEIGAALAQFPSWILPSYQSATLSSLPQSTPAAPYLTFDPNGPVSSYDEGDNTGGNARGQLNYAGERNLAEVDFLTGWPDYLCTASSPNLGTLTATRVLPAATSVSLSVTSTSAELAGNTATITGSFGNLTGYRYLKVAATVTGLAEIGLTVNGHQTWYRLYPSSGYATVDLCRPVSDTDPAFGVGLGPTEWPYGLDITDLTANAQLTAIALRVTGPSMSGGVTSLQPAEIVGSDFAIDGKPWMLDPNDKLSPGVGLSEQLHNGNLSLMADGRRLDYGLLGEAIGSPPVQYDRSIAEFLSDMSTFGPGWTFATSYVNLAAGVYGTLEAGDADTPIGLMRDTRTPSGIDLSHWQRNGYNGWTGSQSFALRQQYRTVSFDNTLRTYAFTAKYVHGVAIDGLAFDFTGAAPATLSPAVWPIMVLGGTGLTTMLTIASPLSTATTGQPAGYYRYVSTGNTSGETGGLLVPSNAEGGAALVEVDPDHEAAIQRAAAIIVAPADLGPDMKADSATGRIWIAESSSGTIGVSAYRGCDLAAEVTVTDLRAGTQPLIWLDAVAGKHVIVWVSSVDGYVKRATTMDEFSTLTDDMSVFSMTGSNPAFYVDRQTLVEYHTQVTSNGDGTENVIARRLDAQGNWLAWGDSSTEKAVLANQAAGGRATIERNLADSGHPLLMTHGSNLWQSADEGETWTTVF